MTYFEGRSRVVPGRPSLLFEFLVAIAAPHAAGVKDFGGSHLKAAVLKASGKISTGPLRVKTPKPATPDAVVEALIDLSQRLGHFDRVSIGFPGVVHADFVLTAPNLGTEAWHGFGLGAVLVEALDKPVRMLNDASIQGLGVISARGLECVLTMGTGMGFALFQDRQIAPHLELSQQPIRKRKTYDEYVGKAALESVGRWRWNKRVHKIISILKTVIMTCFTSVGQCTADRTAITCQCEDRFPHGWDNWRRAALGRVNGSRICRATTRFC